jgi:hypothetical protein
LKQNVLLLIKQHKKILRFLAIAFTCFFVLGIALVTFQIFSHNRPLQLPSPTGSHSVGRTEYDWVDGSRSDPFADQRDENRELLVWVWYPVDVHPGSSLAPYLPANWLRARNRDQGIGQVIEMNFSAIRTHSYEDAPLAEVQGSYPVIIMQPGMGPSIPDYTVPAENLASHGYIVVGINEPHTSNLVVYPDGRIVTRTPQGTIPDKADAIAANDDANRIQKTWVADALFVMGQLQSLNADPTSRFYKELDLSQIGFFGHSFGGATAIRVCELDMRCKAAADLDGTLFSDESTENIHQPILFMAEDRCGDNCDTMHQVYSNASGPAYFISVQKTKHFNFSDLPLRLTPLARVLFSQIGYIGMISPARGLEISNAYLVAFFDQSLKGISSDLLQGTTQKYPEVQFENH